MNKKLIVIGAILLVVALAVTGVILGYNAWYQNTHVFVDAVPYEKDLTFVDLRGTGVSLDYYESLHSQLPDCEIRYDLPFQGGFYPDDTTELTITELSDADIALLDYLPELKTVDARECKDYEHLLALQARRPDCQVLYSVELLGETYDQDAREMTFDARQPQYAELNQALSWLPDMESIHINQPEMAAKDLRKLVQDYPNVTFTWEKDAFGSTYSQDVAEIELKDMYFASLDEVEAQAAYFPALEKLVLLDCGYDKKNLFDDETLAAFREKMRPEYKVVWSMNLYGMLIRTDDLYFMPNKYGVRVSNYAIGRLKYCEDMLCVDLGHHNIVDLSFVEGMPHLKYFICVDSNLLYIQPLSTCKELIYCELFWTPISDFTPLLECTALEDLNIAGTNGDPMIFKDMPWLKNLWVPSYRMTPDRRAELQAALPNTNIVFDTGAYTGDGWRQLQNYYDMRDLLGMAYNTW